MTSIDETSWALERNPRSISQFILHGLLREVDMPLIPFEAAEGVHINLGPGKKHIRDTEELEPPEWYGGMRMPYADESIGVFYAYHFMEHLDSTALWEVLSEINRCLRPQGLVYICVPYGVGHMAVQDPTHQTFFNEDSWRMFLDNNYYSISPANPNGVNLSLEIRTNFIAGVKGENLALFTILEKT